MPHRGGNCRPLGQAPSQPGSEAEPGLGGAPGARTGDKGVAWPRAASPAGESLEGRRGAPRGLCSVFTDSLTPQAARGKSMA